MSRFKPKKRKRKAGRGIRYLLLGALLCAAVLAVLIKLDIISPSLILKRPAAADAGTTVRFIDVGQGDCTLAVSEGKALLIDSGETDERDRVIAYIKSLGLKRLECIVVTHPHSDHMGEMADIIDSLEVGRIIMPEIPREKITAGYSYDRLLKAADRKNVPVEAAESGSFTVGELEVGLFVPLAQTDDLNDCSVITKLTHGSNSFLIMADCGSAEEQELLQSGFDLKSDVLRVGHHGSSSSSSEQFLEAVRPAYAVISCGAGNDYGHPSEKALKRLKAFARETYITRDSGTVTFVSDGGGITVICEK